MTKRTEFPPEKKRRGHTANGTTNPHKFSFKLWTVHGEDAHTEKGAAIGISGQCKDLGSIPAPGEFRELV